jgi:uncharacterized membrane protein
MPAGRRRHRYISSLKEAEIQPTTRTTGPMRSPAIRRLAISLTAGTATAVLIIVFGDWRSAPAVGWDVTALVFIVWIWRVTWPLSADGTASHATEEDPNRATADTIILGACVASLVAVGLVLVRGHSAGPVGEALYAGMSLASLAISWFTVHTVYTLRYARLYYAEPVGGIDFNQPDPPSYQDFAYVALTLGMTFQVSDTTLQNSQIRSAALKHALLSYLFGAIILATAINLVAGLGSSGSLVP